eukprot:Skav235373  [mRNA]  locus=scaffold6992:6476:6667:- [translate_table: standard]
MFLNKPSEHEKWVCGVPEKWQQKWANVQYFLSSVESVDCDKKELQSMSTCFHSYIFFECYEVI